MKILPTLAEVREIASDVNYNVLPVSCEILSDFTTPHRNHKDTEKCIDSLLYAGIRPGERNLGTLYIPRL